MIIILLGLLDAIIAISSILRGYGLYAKWMVVAFSLYLIVKGVIFIKSAASILDIIAGALLFIGLFADLPIVVFWIIGAYLLQKGIFSFF